MRQASPFSNTDSVCAQRTCMCLFKYDSIWPGLILIYSLYCHDMHHSLQLTYVALFVNHVSVQLLISHLGPQSTFSRFYEYSCCLDILSHQLNSRKKMGRNVGENTFHMRMSRDTSKWTQGLAIKTTEMNKLQSTEIRYIASWSRKNGEGENKDIHILSLVHMQQGK